METKNPIASPVVYPQITVGGTQYDLKFSHTAWVKLAQWNVDVVKALSGEKPLGLVALAAAAAGHIDQQTGRWRSADFDRPADLTDAMIEGETVSNLFQPVVEAIKKVAPEAKIEAAAVPASDAPVN